MLTKKIYAKSVILLITLIGLMACQLEKENTNNTASDALKKANTEQAQTGEVQPTIYEDKDLRIYAAFVRVAPKSGMTAGYLAVEWLATEKDSLVAFSTTVAANHEIHETYDKENGMMGMRQIKGMSLSNTSIAEFKPGGPHLMIMQLNQTLEEGQFVDIELMFVNKESISVKFPVKSLIGN